MAASTGILKDAEHDQVNISPPNNIQVYQNYDEAEDDEDPWTRAEKDVSRHQGPFFDSTKKKNREIP